MPLDATRLANAAIAAWTADTARNGFSPSLTLAQQNAVRSLVEAIVSAVVVEIVTNAVVSTTGGSGTVF